MPRWSSFQEHFSCIFLVQTILLRGIPILFVSVLKILFINVFSPHLPPPPHAGPCSSLRSPPPSFFSTLSRMRLQSMLPRSPRQASHNQGPRAHPTALPPLKQSGKVTEIGFVQFSEVFHPPPNSSKSPFFVVKSLVELHFGFQIK